MAKQAVDIQVMGTGLMLALGGVDVQAFWNDVTPVAVGRWRKTLTPLRSSWVRTAPPVGGHWEKN